MCVLRDEKIIFFLSELQKLINFFLSSKCGVIQLLDTSKLRWLRRKCITLTSSYNQIFNQGYFLWNELFFFLQRLLSSFNDIYVTFDCTWYYSILFLRNNFVYRLFYIVILSVHIDMFAWEIYKKIALRITEEYVAHDTYMYRVVG